MGVKITSKWAYWDHLDSGAARTQRDQIYLAMVRFGAPINRNQVSADTEIRINAVCGRIHELLKIGAIEVAHKAVDPFGPAKTPVEYLKVMPREERVEQMGLI